MDYYINIGGLILNEVTSVEESSDRDIKEYKGIGQGSFPVADTKSLRTWTISCRLTEKNERGLPNWRSASEMFSKFEVLLSTKDSSRFIFVSDNHSESLLCLLKSYSKKEVYDGVYDVTLKVMEYVPTGVKSEDVPYIARPGKVPVAATTIPKGGNAYSEIKKATGELATQGMNTLADRNRSERNQNLANQAAAKLVERNTQKTIENAALAKPGDQIVTVHQSRESIQKQNEAIINGVKSAFDSMKNALSKFREEHGSPSNYEPTKRW